MKSSTSILTALVLLLTVVYVNTMYADEPTSEFQFGVELGEVANSKKGTIESDSYSLFFGQRFTSEDAHHFGWRFMRFEVDMKSSQIQGTASAHGWIQGNPSGVAVRQKLTRFTLDYYPLEITKGFFAFRPIIGPTFGSTVREVSTPRPSLVLANLLASDAVAYVLASRQNSDLAIAYYSGRSANPTESIAFLYHGMPFRETATQTTNMVGASLRLQFTFWELLFIEPEINGGPQQRAQSSWLSDTYLSHPPKTVLNKWLHFGVLYKF